MDDDLIIKTLYDKKRRTILGLLRERYPDGLSFSEIARLTDLKPTTVAYHLGKLTNVELIEKVPGTRPGKRDYSFYRATEKGLQGLEIVRELGETRSSENSDITIPNKIEIISNESMPAGYLIRKLWM